MTKVDRLAAESSRATGLLQGKVVSRIERRQTGALIEFTDGERLYVDRAGDDVELSITSGASTEPTLLVREAYVAMFAFLESHYRSTGSDDIGALLGDLSLLADGSPADAAVTTDWAKAVELARGGQVDVELRLDGGASEL